MTDASDVEDLARIIDPEAFKFVDDYWHKKAISTATRIHAAGFRRAPGREDLAYEISNAMGNTMDQSDEFRIADYLIAHIWGDAKP